MKKISVIKNDVFDITDRVKSIDRGYFIVYNHSDSRFELHHEDCKPTLQLVIPYKSLDARTVNLVLATRVERMQNTILEMDEKNERLNEKKEKELIDKLHYKSRNLIDFYDKGGKEIVQYEKI